MRIEQKCSGDNSDATKEIKKQARARVDQRSGLDIGEVAKPVEKALNRLTKGTDEREKGVSGNQDIPIPLKLLGLEATLRIFQLLIRIATKRMPEKNCLCRDLTTWHGNIGLSGHYKDQKAPATEIIVPKIAAVCCYGEAHSLLRHLAISCQPIQHR